MFQDENSKCHGIIHSASIAAGGVGAGLAQLPLADAIPLIGIQVTMIISLGKVYDIELTESGAKSLIGAFASTTVGRHVAGVLVGWIPVWGNALKGATAATITETIGWSAVKHFENQRNDKKEERKRGYSHGVKEGEILAKEKFNDILKKSKHRDYFLSSCISLSLYLLSDCKEGREKGKKYILNLIKSLDFETKKRFELNFDENITFEKVIEYTDFFNLEEIKTLDEIAHDIYGVPSGKRGITTLRIFLTIYDPFIFNA